MKNHHLPISGTLIPNSKTPINFPKEWKLSEQKLWVVLWIQYKFSDEKSEECTFISHVIGECTDGHPPVYLSNDNLKKDQKEFDDILAGKNKILN